MADLTEAQKREIESKKDTQVKDALKEEVVAKTREMKQKNKAIKEEASLQEANKDKYDFDDQPFFTQVDANGKKIVGKIERKADHLIGKGVGAASDWAVEMYNLLSASLELNKALYYDPLKLPFEDTVKGVGKALWQRTVVAGAEAISDKISRRFVKDEELAKINFGAGVDENGILSSSVTKNNKTWPEMGGLFNQGICDWAKLQGYQALQQNGQLVLQDKNGVKMTPQKFKELNDNVDTSLEKFLSSRMGMKINYSGPTQQAADEEENNPPAPRMN